MAQNLELKAKVDSFDEILMRLEKVAAEDKGVLNQKDTYYKYDKGRLKLRSVNGRFELIKYRRDESAEQRYSNYFLLYLEGDEVEEYLNDILQVEVIVEKSRRLFIYKDTRIHLDEVKNLGTFMELETLVLNGHEDAEVRFNEIIELLGLNKENEIRVSYRELMLAK